jgi:hypothetical protein
MARRPRSNPESSPTAPSRVPSYSNPSVPSAAWHRMAEDWALADHLLGGTRAMRRAGTRYLPQEDGESDPNYQNRLSRSVLFNGFAHTIDSLVGKVFEAPAMLEEGFEDSEWQDWTDDIDQSGNNLSVFAAELLREMLAHGKTHVMPEYPKAAGTETLGQEMALGLRPYLVHRKAPDVIGWRSQITSGAERLERCRIKEKITDYVGEWDDDGERFQVRVLRPGSWEVWREVSGQGDWQLIDTGVTLNQEGVPLLPIYAKRTEFMEAQSPLLDLAWLNVLHWQSSSDQRNILHFARCGILFGKGINSQELGAEKRFILGGNRALFVGGDQADMKWVTHDGNGIAAGRIDLQDLQEQMAIYGAQLLVKPTGNPTATGEAIDTAESQSVLSQIVDRLQDGINLSFERMAEYRKVSKVPVCKLNRDFGITSTQQDLNVLLAARAKGDISRQTFLSELQRRGLLSDDFDADVDKEQLKDDPPVMLSPAGSGGGGGFGSRTPRPGLPPPAPGD